MKKCTSYVRGNGFVQDKYKGYNPKVGTVFY